MKMTEQNEARTSAELVKQPETHFVVAPMKSTPQCFADAATWAFDHDTSGIGTSLINNFTLFDANTGERLEKYTSLANQSVSIAEMARNQFEGIKRRKVTATENTNWRDQKINRGKFSQQLKQFAKTLVQTALDPDLIKNDQYQIFSRYMAYVAEDTALLAEKSPGICHLEKISPEDMAKTINLILGITKTAPLTFENTNTSGKLEVPILVIARAASILNTNAVNYQDQHRLKIPVTFEKSFGEIITLYYKDEFDPRYQKQAVRLVISDKSVRIEVTNTGDYLTEEQLKNMFDVKKAILVDSKRPHLGLIQLRRLAQASNGTISVDSIPDPEQPKVYLNTFSFTVPI